MTERTIPILPCSSIDDVLAFYRALGFDVTYQQERPDTFAVVKGRGHRAEARSIDDELRRAAELEEELRRG